MSTMDYDYYRVSILQQIYDGNNPPGRGMVRC